MSAKQKLKLWRAEYVKTLRGRALKLINNARSRSNTKGIEITLDVDWLVDKLEKGVCELTGMSFNLDAPVNESRRVDAPSLDRIDKNKGYTPDNTRVVLWAVNNALGEYGTERIYPILQAMIKGIEDARQNQPAPVSVEHTGESQGNTQSGTIHGAGAREDCDGVIHHRGEPEREDACDSTQEGCRICMGARGKQVEALELYENCQDYGLTETETRRLAELFGCICYQP